MGIVGQVVFAAHVATLATCPPFTNIENDRKTLLRMYNCSKILKDRSGYEIYTRCANPGPLQEISGVWHGGFELSDFFPETKCSRKHELIFKDTKLQSKLSGDFSGAHIYKVIFNGRYIYNADGRIIVLEGIKKITRIN